MAAADFLSWLMETTLATSALIVLVLIVRRPVARRFGAEAAYLLWLAPALRFVAPEIAVLPAPAESLFAPSAAAATMDLSALTVAPFAAAAQEPDIHLLFIALWGMGALAYALWQFGAQRAFRMRLLATSRPAPQDLLAEATTVSWRRGYRRGFDLRVAADETGPLVAGFFRPVIVVPACFATRLSSHERQMALAHEFAHVARGDLYAAFAATVLRALQWFNPVVHAAWRAFRADQEAACDALVLRRSTDDPKSSNVYAEALVKAARGPAPTHALSIAFDLKERLVLMKTATRARPAARAAAICAVVVGVAVSASYSHAEEKKAAAQETKTVEIKRMTVLGDGEQATSSEDGKTIVMVRKSGGADVDVAEVLAGLPPMDGTPRVMVLGGGDVSVADGKIAVEGVDCKDADGKPVKPLIDEKSESADGKTKFVDRMIICSTKNGTPDPKKEAAALRKAVASLHAEAAREADRRQRMIAALEARIAELDKTAK